MLKRLFDVVGSLVGLVLMSLVLVVVSISVAVALGYPILFCQIRPGLHGRPFMIRKFRTMTNVVDENGLFLPDEARLTRIGRFLRATSLDELPELWNVLVGEMSLVGPRPLRMHYLERYSARQARRHEVRPGITGWAQVHGRNGLSWEERFELDVWYVEHWSLWLDLKILALTALAVVRREGISAEGHASMPEFGGTSKGV